MKNEIYEICKNTADELDAIACGKLYRCPKCGETCTYDENDDGTYTTSCGCTVYDEPGLFTFYDWMDDILDIEYIVSSRKKYIGARIMITCGGPAVFVNTREGIVKAYWWNESAEYNLFSHTANALDEVLSEYWESI